ncbi:hypothetical protein [uncultured Thioclava sp.]|jgi:uncharacterized membrane protein YeiB|uniref:Major facilitator superfamily (MFS) profile domain-containing protein n=1 Tax=Thioclava arctica TaxID=3238301 RepID=A0ABV3TKU4_9RHOB|nr:hypothetical protein [uncultured Thioclava sp.]
MNAAITPQSNKGALSLYLLAALIVAGLVFGTLLFGLLGTTVWMIAMTFVVFVVLVGISFS